MINILRHFGDATITRSYRRQNKRTKTKSKKRGSLTTITDCTNDWHEKKKKTKDKSNERYKALYCYTFLIISLIALGFTMVSTGSTLTRRAGFRRLLHIRHRHTLHHS